MTLAHRILVTATCIGALAVAAGAGCKREHVDRDGFAERSFDQGAGTTTVTGAELGALTSESAIERITVARCARESACNNVGTDKHFVNDDACARDMRSKVGEDLAPAKCPRGVDVTAVDTCTEAIRSESCNNPVDTISRLAACRAGALCIEPGKAR